MTTTARHERIRVPQQSAPAGAPLTSEPLTSEPPLPEASPLTSEPPLTAEAHLTSEPTAPVHAGGPESPGV
ncbi:hypothetical protein [Streptomyces bikiniensis]|uniref:Uncharacterized protein n=1 Tax=Streptomyces bikiniensis TaxID=1896 RepID=A0ABW8CQI0_STRBI|nr:hypothetical protein [Streptomyces bikiniensis]